MKRLLAIALGLLWPVTGHAGADVAVSPLTLLENGNVAGCGLSSTVRTPQNTAIADVIAFRDGNATAFAVRARTQSDTPQAVGVRLITATHDTASDFPSVRPIDGGLVETRTVLEGFDGSSFAQALMVTGGRFEITLSGGMTLAYDLPRPMPHGVRQAYLNCAGDLFRPETESP